MLLLVLIDILFEEGGAWYASELKPTLLTSRLQTAYMLDYLAMNYEQQEAHNFWHYLDNDGALSFTFFPPVYQRARE